ncbi:RelA/SpoT family protein [Bradyrhizobium sp. AUGA SZCCT0274]|uniref:GTP pyrophosphokinase n=1 Tax=Bradyrhizobium sp. AUGA SZCCT0274 TaxID=2807670 RepID=UPI001BA7DBA7|nr:RelA/SpoT family protein [Bradyrhizobium sp. AUGA SZCCT0274]MBR1241497.1 RelA/SpoT family protein [Bradyrhizobium sp. AUGA SZCCT0274]
MYEKWGVCIATRLVNDLGPLIAPASTELFVKLPITPRLKTGGSFITKAFYNTKRKTPYQNPYDEITDKVGVRLVVLLPTQISRVQAALEHCDLWDFSKDRDYEQEIAEKPYVFEYQSVHYVVRAKTDIDVDGTMVRKGTPCEVQIRTLLQHAHSELTHDTIYKPSVEKTPQMERAVSKAMALIEATSDYFEDVARLIEGLTSPSRKLTEELIHLYAERIGRAAEPTKVDGLLLEAFGSDEPAMDALRQFLDEKSYLAEHIAERAKTKILFRQPSILLVYKAVSEGWRQASAKWPLTPNELAPVFSDLGISRQ